MSRMSSPDGSEILTVETEVGANVLASLGWTRETNTRRSSKSEPEQRSAGSEQAADAADEPPRRRGPGRPRKQPNGDAEG